jgi:hypothetical protein
MTAAGHRYGTAVTTFRKGQTGQSTSQAGRSVINLSFPNIKTSKFFSNNTGKKVVYGFITAIPIARTV